MCNDSHARRSIRSRRIATGSGERLQTSPLVESHAGAEPFMAITSPSDPGQLVCTLSGQRLTIDVQTMPEGLRERIGLEPTATTAIATFIDRDGRGDELHFETDERVLIHDLPEGLSLLEGEHPAAFDEPVIDVEFEVVGPTDRIIETEPTAVAGEIESAPGGLIQNDTIGGTRSSVEVPTELLTETVEAPAGVAVG